MMRLAKLCTTAAALTRLRQGSRPSALLDEPLLDEHGRQLAVEFTQDTPGVLDFAIRRSAHALSTSGRAARSASGAASLTKASGKLSRARGTLVTTIVQPARYNTSSEGSRPWAWAASRMRVPRCSLTSSDTRTMISLDLQLGLLAQEHS
jgi:hypothetical protein